MPYLEQTFQIWSKYGANTENPGGDDGGLERITFASFAFCKPFDLPARSGRVVALRVVSRKKKKNEQYRPDSAYAIYSSFRSEH